MKKGIYSFVLSIVLIISTFSTVSAKQGIENTGILFKDIKIIVDNKVLQPDTEPFIYQGRTYIPARALAEVMGGKVSWDEQNSTVNVVNQRIYELKVVAMAACNAKLGQQEGASVLIGINNLIDSRNYLAFNAANAISLIANNKNNLSERILDHNYFKSEAILYNFKEANNIIGKDYNNIELAISYYETAYNLVQSGYNFLEMYSYNGSPSYYNSLTECIDKATEYYFLGHEIFTEYYKDFADYIIYN